MVFYTIYLKSLKNDTGYVDIALENDQLYRDYLQFLEIRVVPVRTYRLADPANPTTAAGEFTLNLAEVSAMTIRPA